MKHMVLSQIEQVADALDTYMESHAYVETGFGPASTASGYEWREIRFSERFVSVGVYMLDRKMREQDEYVREGDSACFIYDKKRNLIQTQDERNEEAREIEEAER